jgi:hypothetical protein
MDITPRFLAAAIEVLHYDDPSAKGPLRDEVMIAIGMVKRTLTICEDGVATDITVWSDQATVAIVDRATCLAGSG